MAKPASVEKIEKKNKAAAGLGVDSDYIRVAGYIGKAKWACSVLLLVTILLSVILGRSEITFYNFQYLLKHFLVNSADDSSNFRELTYDSDGSYSFGYYKNDLVVVSTRGVDFYDMRGQSVLTKAHAMSKPQMAVSEQYLYIYDQGFNTYSVYNSFSCLKTFTTDYPIYKIAGSDSGVYAVLTKANNYKGAVFIYDKNFKTLSEVFKDKYIIDVNLSADGGRVLVLSCDTDENGAFYTELQSIVPGREEAEFTVTIAERFPLCASYYENGNIGVLCAGLFETYNKKGEKIASFDFTGDTTPACGFGGDYAALSFRKNAIGVESLIKIISSDGSVQDAEIELQGEINRLKCEPTGVYALLPDAVARVQTKTGQVAYEKTQSNPLDFIVRDETTLLVCYNNKTQAVNYAFTGLNLEDESDNSDRN